MFVIVVVVVAVIAALGDLGSLPGNLGALLGDAADLGGGGSGGALDSGAGLVHTLVMGDRGGGEGHGRGGQEGDEGSESGELHFDVCDVLWMKVFVCLWFERSDVFAKMSVIRMRRERRSRGREDGGWFLIPVSRPWKTID